jgi:chromosome segregation ATPase
MIYALKNRVLDIEMKRQELMENQVKIFENSKSNQTQLDDISTQIQELQLQSKELDEKKRVFESELQEKRREKREKQSQEEGMYHAFSDYLGLELIPCKGIGA